ncbi:hypothetical protein ACIP79_08195 [Streptomyces sp. NPDC088747]|uniref:hypothetical protein n=1 Tax=Streptomyces sp. NPDC088747 TaxID=3365886 RepID=UPI00380E598E
MTIPAPVTAHPNEDVDHLAARASKLTFVAKARAVRENFNTSDRFKTEQVSGLYDAHVQETADAYERLTTRRRDRLAYLESLVPVGTGIAENATPADKAVLMTAFRAAWKEAQEADRAGRMRMLAEAERFGDDATRRAVLTFAVDHSELDTVRAWTDFHLDEKGMVDEARELREALAGRSPLHGFERQDFTPVPKPQEAYDWPRIKDHPTAEPRDPGREVRPGVIERSRR